MKRCGCEDGYDCTRTSVCAVESAVEDATIELQQEVYNLMAERDIYWNVYQAALNRSSTHAMSVCCPMKSGQIKKADAALEEAIDLAVEWENDL